MSFYSPTCGSIRSLWNAQTSISIHWSSESREEIGQKVNTSSSDRDRQAHSFIHTVYVDRHQSHKESITMQRWGTHNNDKRGSVPVWVQISSHSVAPDDIYTPRTRFTASHRSRQSSTAIYTHTLRIHIPRYAHSLQSLAASIFFLVLSIHVFQFNLGKTKIKQISCQIRVFSYSLREIDRI